MTNEAWKELLPALIKGIRQMPVIRDYPQFKCMVSMDGYVRVPELYNSLFCSYISQQLYCYDFFFKGMVLICYQNASNNSLMHWSILWKKKHIPQLLINRTIKTKPKQIRHILEAYSICFEHIWRKAVQSTTTCCLLYQSYCKGRQQRFLNLFFSKSQLPSSFSWTLFGTSIEDRSRSEDWRTIL